MSFSRTRGSVVFHFTLTEMNGSCLVTEKKSFLYEALTHTSYAPMKTQLHPLHPNPWDGCLGYSNHADIIWVKEGGVEGE